MSFTGTPVAFNSQIKGMCKEGPEAISTWGHDCFRCDRNGNVPFALFPAAFGKTDNAIHAGNMEFLHVAARPMHFNLIDRRGLAQSEVRPLVA